jgi:hypothetical protein
MSARRLPDWLSAYDEYTAITEAPQQFNFWVGVWTLGGALKRKVFLDMGHFQWIPNFYIFLVSPPGIISKSTTLSIGAALLREVPGVQFGPEALTWQVLVESLANSKEEVPMNLDGAPVFFPMSCLSIAAGELGTLVAPNNREMIDALVSLWDGKVGAWEKWTKTSGKDSIINPFINIASCTTPSWIGQNFPEELVGGGFTSRCIFIFGEEKRQLIAYPSAKIPPGFKTLKESLIEDLIRISTLTGKFTLSPGAVALGEKWYENHYSSDQSEMSRFAGYLARKQTHIHKLAMVLSVSRRDDLIIDEKILQLAIDKVTAVEPSMKRVFDAIGLEGAGKRLSLLVETLRPFGKLRKPDLFSRVCFKMSAEEFDETLFSGSRSGLIAVEPAIGEPFIALRGNS